MSVIELLDSLISDMNDYILEYEDRIKLSNSRLKKQKLEIRIDELKQWKKKC